MTESEAREFLEAGVRDAGIHSIGPSPDTAGRAASRVNPAGLRPDEVWADLGAGDGTFTRALASILGGSATVYAVDRDAAAMRSLARGTTGTPAPAGDSRGVGAPRSASVQTFVADIENLAPFARAIGTTLDGVVIANALHYVPHARQRDTLAAIAAIVRPGGRIIVIEYEHRAANRWVPYPLPFARLTEIVPPTVGAPEQRATRASAFGGAMYLAVVEVSDRKGSVY